MVNVEDLEWMDKNQEISGSRPPKGLETFAPLLVPPCYSVVNAGGNSCNWHRNKTPM